MAIEFHQPKQISGGPDLCKYNSSEELDHLIRSCDYNTLLRNLNDEEKLEIKKYQEEQKSKYSSLGKIAKS